MRAEGTFQASAQRQPLHAVHAGEVAQPSRTEPGGLGPLQGRLAHQRPRLGLHAADVGVGGHGDVGRQRVEDVPVPRILREHLRRVLRELGAAEHPDGDLLVQVVVRHLPAAADDARARDSRARSPCAGFRFPDGGAASTSCRSIRSRARSRCPRAAGSRNAARVKLNAMRTTCPVCRSMYTAPTTRGCVSSFGRTLTSYTSMR